MNTIAATGPLKNLILLNNDELTVLDQVEI